MRCLHATVVDKVVLQLVHLAFARHLAVAFTLGGLACTSIHTGAAQETVLVAQQCAGTTLVAGTQLEELDILDLVVLQLVEEVHHVLQAVYSIAFLGKADAALAIVEGAEYCVARKVDGAALLGNVVLALLLDFAIGAVEERVHIDHAVNDRALLAHRSLDSGNLGGAGGDIEQTYLLARDATVLQLLQAIDGRNVERGLDGKYILYKRGIFNLYKSDDGGAEARNQRADIGVLAGVALLGSDSTSKTWRKPRSSRALYIRDTRISSGN